MVSQHLHDISKMDMMSLDTGEYKWINFTQEIDLSGLEKIHTGGSSDSYILHSIQAPKVHMGVKREEFFKSLLNKHADALLTGARIFVTRMDEELVDHSDCRIKGLPGNIDQTKPPKNFKDAMGRKDRQEWAEAYDAEHQGFYEPQDPKTGARHQDLGKNYAHGIQDCKWSIQQAQGASVCDG
jgi:hypothetical protein